MKVAIYSGRIPATTFIERLIDGLAAEGVEVWVFGEIADPVSYESPNIRVCGWRGRWGRWMALLKYLVLFLVWRRRDLIKMLANLNGEGVRQTAWKLSKFLPVLWYRPDIFHLQWAKWLEDWVWVQDFGIKLVLSLRGAHINYSPVVNTNLAETYRRLFPRVEEFHAVSAAIAHQAQQYGAPANRIQVVCSGLPVEQFPFTPDKPRRKRLHIISVGRPHWIKGYTYALDACRLLLGKLDFRYTIVGGRCEEHLYHVRDAGLDRYVELTDPLPFEQVLQRVRSADVLVLSSVEEGIANVVLEAMALGTPVISTDCGGMAEVIEDGVNGFLVPVRDPQVLAAAIVRFAGLPEQERQAIALAARKTIEQRFYVRQMVEGTIALYHHVLADSRVRTGDGYVRGLEFR